MTSQTLTPGETLKKTFLPKTLIKKILFSLMILALYRIGLGIPAYGIDPAAYGAAGGAGDLIMRTVGGDRLHISIFALGISPFMFASLLVGLVQAVKDPSGRRRTSPKRTKTATCAVMLVWALVQAWFTTGSAHYAEGGAQLLTARLISGAEMTAGAFLIYLLGKTNEKHGIGGYMLLVFVNILDGLIYTVSAAGPAKTLPAAAIGFFVLICTVIFEITEYRIPMQRISVHSIYSDKNYIPIKLNPVGMMPVMLASAFFMLPVYAVRLLSDILPVGNIMARAAENMDTSHALGICVYVAVLYAVTVAFSFILIGPSRLAEDLQRAGDSITGLRSGRLTRKYISRRVLVISLFSATFTAVFICLPMALAAKGYIDASVTGLPAVMIALGSIGCALCRQLRAAADEDAYVPFI